MLPHPYSQKSCDFHSYVPSELWSASRYCRVCYVAFAKGVCACNSFWSASRCYRICRVVFAERVSACNLPRAVRDLAHACLESWPRAGRTVRRGEVEDIRKLPSIHLRAPCTSGTDRNGPKKKAHCYATTVRHCDQQLSASTICYAIVTSNRSASPKRLRQSRSKTSPLPSSDRMEGINTEQVNGRPQRYNTWKPKRPTGTDAEHQPEGSGSIPAGERL